MTLEEEVKQMRIRGLSDNQIRDNLKVRGTPEQKISELMSQNMTNQTQQRQEPQQYEPQAPQGFPIPEQNSAVEPKIKNQDMGEMEKSILIPPQEGYKEKEYEPNQKSTIQEYSAPEPSYGYQDYQPYQSYSSGPSPDLITEIAEQIIAEKLSVVRKALEKSLDLRNTIGAKVDYLDERLKRIEKTIDSLQSAVLKKVGDYINDVQDIKKEIIETQKSLKKVNSKKKHKKRN